MEKQENEKIPILEAFKLVLPYLNQIVREDMAVGLTDLNEYLGSHQAKGFEINLPIGKPIKGIERIEECIKTGKATEITGAVSQQQAASTQEIMSTLEEINSTAKRLELVINRYR